MKFSRFTILWPAFTVVLLDQFSKIWVRSSMIIGESIPVIGSDFFRLTYVQNTGIAFGFRAGSPIFLIIFSAVASVLIFHILLFTRSRTMIFDSKTIRTALSLILGGAIGNLIDRALFLRVTDFLDFDFPDFIMTRWPIFNIADMAVTIGVTLWCLHLIFSAKYPTSAEYSPP